MKNGVWRVVGVCGLAAFAARGDVAALTASRDNTLYQDPLGSLSSGSGPTMFAGDTVAGQLRRGLVRFDLSGVPPGSTVVSVRLALHLSRTISGDTGVSIFRALHDWGEGASDAGIDGGQGIQAAPGDATWLHTFYDTQFWSGPGGVPGADYAATSSATAIIGSTVQTYTWGSTPAMVADAQAWLDSASTDFGWFIIGDEATMGSAKRFDTRDASDPVLRPVLTVTYIPPACYANCDGSTVGPILNANDFQCFLNKFAAGDSYANCDGSTVSPILNANDFQCFLNAYAAGC